jgi:hypothetical protein
MNKVAITIDELLHNVPKEIEQRSRVYKPKMISHLKNRWVYKVKNYLVRLRIPRIKSDILVSCTCDFWKWNGPDYHAVINDYSERSFSDMSEPVERDPQSKFNICKHVCAVLKQFKSDNDV